MANRGRCKTCDAEIVWAKTEKGRPIPLDREPELRYVREGESDIVILRSTYQTHFVTCPDAKEHRKREKARG